MEPGPIPPPLGEDFPAAVPREAFPDNTAPKYLILDCDAIFRPEIMRFIKAMGTTPRHIGYRSPWQSPVAER